jgi:bifunctional non-homologous end joining protein LigD
MKRAPSPRPVWIRTCAIEHASGNVIDFPIVQDLASLLWLVNLGCIDLNPWYARCDDIHRPDYLHFDLDPVTGAGLDQVREDPRACSMAQVEHEQIAVGFDWRRGLEAGPPLIKK